LRKRLWQLHSWLGLIAGLGLLVIGLTGSVLVFHAELSAIVSPDKFAVTPTSAGRLPLDELLAHAQRQLPDHEITGWLVQHDHPDRADDLYLIRRGDNVWLTGTLDPYTGRVLSAPHLGSTTLRGWLLDLHYTFFADDLGVALAGVFAVLLCALGVSGVWLYREFWRHLFTFRWRRGARLLFSDLHKFVGISSVAANLILGATGAYWNVAHVIEHLSGHEPEQTRIERRLYADTLSLDAIVRDAAQQLPGFRANFISLPSDPAAPAVILWGAVEPRPALTSPYGTTLFYDPQTGAHRSTNDLRAASWWARVKDAFEPLHFGYFGGLVTRILWCLAGFAPGVLAVSGFVLWQLRRRSAARRNAAALSLSSTA
jgi:uncharacterized iron-regulated membrane protein